SPLAGPQRASAPERAGGVGVSHQRPPRDLTKPGRPSTQVCFDCWMTPLDGILVADFSRVLAGPLATMTLADLGATVVKVERPGEGDETRAWGPPWTATSSSYFDCVNRGKLGVALDLADGADRARAVELARRADVVVHNLRGLE